MKNTKRYIAIFMTMVITITSLVFATPTSVVYAKEFQPQDNNEYNLYDDSTDDYEYLFDAKRAEQKKNQIIVKYKENADTYSTLQRAESALEDRALITDTDKTLKTPELSVDKTFSRYDIEVISVSEDTDIMAFIDILNNDDTIEYAQPNYELTSFSVPENECLPLQWGLQNSGQVINGFAGTSGIDINIAPIWDADINLLGSRVAVLDTGIDIYNTNLIGKTADGWDFYNNTSDVYCYDGDSHGTNIAGVIASNMGLNGIAGVSQNAVIVPLKFIENGVGYTSDAIAAIEYAAMIGVKVINCSWGSEYYNPALRAVMEQYSDILFVCAAGNSGGSSFVYPAAFGLPNILSVTSVNNRGELSDFGNFGSLVSIAAPGEDIYTTGANGGYEYISGTSMSAAFVTGAAAVGFGVNANVSAAEMAYLIKENGQKLNNLQNNVPNGILDLNSLIEAILESDPEDPIEFPIEEETFPLILEDIFAAGLRFSQLSDLEKQALNTYLYVRFDTMEECDNYGFNVKESYKKARIMQQFGLNIYEALDMINEFGDENTAAEQATVFGNKQMYSPAITNDASAVLIPLIVAGYTAESVINAFIASIVLEEDINAIITKNIYSEPVDLSGFDNSDADLLMELAGQYYVKPGVLVGYVIENDTTVPDLQVLLLMNMAQAGLLAGDANITLSESSITQLNELLTTAFNYRQGINEKINLNTGALTYEEQIVTLAGKNGFDLDLTLRYESSQATLDYIKYTTIHDYAVDRYGFIYMYDNSFNPNDYLYTIGIYDMNIAIDTKQNPLYYMGVGWSFNFPRIFIESDYYSLTSITLALANPPTYSYVRLADGSKHKINNKNDELENYKDSDMYLSIVQYNSNNIFPNASRTLSYDTGRIEYFNSEGHIIGISDKYGNTIRIDYIAGNGHGENNNIYPNTYNISDVLITDSNGKEIKLYYDYTNGKDINIELPDSNIIKYSLTEKNVAVKQGHPNNPPVLKPYYDVLSVKTDQLGRTKQYTYDEFDLEDHSHYSSPYPYMIRTVTRKYFMLTSVTNHTGVSTHYDYVVFKGRMDEYNSTHFAAVTRRYEKLGNTVYNDETYAWSDANYISKYAYPYTSYYWGGNLSDTDTYTVTVSDRKGVSTTYVHGKKHVLQTETTTVNNIIKQIKEYTYDSNNWDHFRPLGITTKTHKGTATNNTFYSKTESFSYNPGGSVTSYSDGSGYVQNMSFDTDYYKFYPLYDSINKFHNPPYNVLTSRTHLNGVEIYELTPDRKMPQKVTVTENGVVKSRTEYEYNTDGNVTVKKEYFADSANAYIYTGYTYGSGTQSSLVTSKTTAGVTEYYTYDAMDRLLTITNGNNQTTEMTYDAIGRITSVTNPDNTTQTYIYDDVLNTTLVKDENNNQIRYDYDAFGNLVKIFDITGNVVLNTYSYDKFMRLVFEKDAMGIATSYNYDPLGRVFEKGISSKYDYMSLSYETYYVERYEYEDVFDANTSRVIKSGFGIKTAEYYDKWGKMVKDSVFDGLTEISNTYKYDALGNLLEERSAQHISENKPFTNKYEYDYAGRMTKTTNADNKVYTNSYDLLGRPTSSTDPKGNITTYSYNSRGLLESETVPLSGTDTSVTSYLYDNIGNITSVRVSNNLPGDAPTENRTDYEYNNRNFLTKVSTYDGSTLAEWVSYVYDGVGNTTQMKAANGTQTTAYQYDNRNRVTKMTDPMGLFETYVYDGNGNVTSKVDKKGITTTYTYNALNLPTRVSAGTGSSAPYVEYTYYATGAIRFEENALMNVAYVYDSMGRLTQETETGKANSGLPTIQKQYSYNLDNNRTSFVLRNGNKTVCTIGYTYDILGRLKTVAENSVLQATYAYDDNGNRSKLTYANGFVTDYTYNSANLVTSLTNKDKSGALISRYEYSYYRDGNQAAKSDNEGFATAYTYDYAGRLLTEVETLYTAPNISYSYTYDNAGNRAGLTVTGSQNYAVSYEYNANNRLTKETRTGTEALISTYTYDNNGNQLTKTGGGTTETYVYNALNQQTKFTATGMTAAYTYKPNGMRLSKTENGVKTTHIWDGANIVAEYDGNNALLMYYVRGINLIKRSTGEYYLFNAHGDVTALTVSAIAATPSYSMQSPVPAQNGSLLDLPMFTMTSGTETAGGTLSTGLTWALDEGILTIVGEGAMPHWEPSWKHNDDPNNPLVVPWVAYKQDITKVIIEDGVTVIGDAAFHGCENLASVSMTGTVTHIGSQAFYYTPSLKNVVIPQGVLDIGYQAFAFWSADPNETGGLESIQLPSSLSHIWSQVFMQTALTSLIIPAGVTDIGAGIVQGCANLTSITFTSGRPTVTVDNQAFAGKPAGASVCVPPLWSKYGVTNGSDWHGVQVTYMAGGALNANIDWLYDGYGLLTITGTGAMPNWEAPQTNYYDPNDPLVVPWVHYRFDITTVIISEGITVIGDAAFHGCENLSYVDIPSSVSHIGRESFYHTPKLTYLELPNGVITIDFQAFGFSPSYNRPTGGLTNIKLPDSLKYINAQAFYKCAFTEITIPASVIYIGGGAFQGCGNLTGIIFKSAAPTQYMDTDAFYGVTTDRKSTRLNSSH